MTEPDVTVAKGVFSSAHLSLPLQMTVSVSVPQCRGCSNHTLPRGEMYWVLRNRGSKDFSRMKPVGNIEDVGNVKPSTISQVKAVGNLYLIISKGIRIQLFFISLCTDRIYQEIHCIIQCNEY